MQTFSNNFYKKIFLLILSCFLIFSFTQISFGQDAVDQSTSLSGNPNIYSPNPEGKKTCFDDFSITNFFIGGLFSCGADLLSALLTRLVLPFINYLGYWALRAINGLVFELVRLTGIFFDQAFYWTVVSFTDNFTKLPDPNGNTEGGGIIYYIWTLLRDVLNTAVFFIVIYNGALAMFKGLEDVKKKFISLLVFVVLVNFSLLFVKVVIDVSNIATITIYNTAAKPSGTESIQAFTTPARDDKPATLSEFILNSINPLADKRSAAGREISSKYLEGGSIFYQLFRLAMYILLAFFFIYVGSIFIARAVTLVVVMMLSPLLVAGSFFEAFKTIGDKAKNELIEEVLQAPALIFFIVVASTISYSLFGAVGNNAVDSSILQLNMIMFLKAIFFCVFVFVGFKFVRDATSRGGYLTEKLTGLGVGAAFGLGLYGTRSVLRGGANAILNTTWGGRVKKSAENYLANKKEGNATTVLGWAANKAMRGDNLLQNGSLNPFNTNMGKMIMSASNAQLGTKFKTESWAKIGQGSGKEDKIKKKIEQYERDRDYIANRKKPVYMVSNDEIKNSDVLKGTIESKDYSKEHTYKEITEIVTKSEDAIFRKEVQDKIDANEGGAKLKVGGIEMSYSQWGKALKEEDSNKSFSKSKKELETKLTDKGKRADLVQKLQEQQTKDSIKKMDKGVAENGFRKGIKGKIVSALTSGVYNYTVGENRTYSADLAQARIIKRVKGDDEKNNNQELATVRTIYSTNRSSERFDNEIENISIKIENAQNQILSKQDQAKKEVDEKIIKLDTNLQTSTAQQKASQSNLIDSIKEAGNQIIVLKENIESNVGKDTLKQSIGETNVQNIEYIQNIINNPTAIQTDTNKILNTLNNLQKAMNNEKVISSIQFHTQDSGVSQLKSFLSSQDKLKTARTRLESDTQKAIEATQKVEEERKKLQAERDALETEKLNPSSPTNEELKRTNKAKEALIEFIQKTKDFKKRLILQFEVENIEDLNKRLIKKDSNIDEDDFDSLFTYLKEREQQLGVIEKFIPDLKFLDKDFQSRIDKEIENINKAIKEILNLKDQKEKDKKSSAK